MLSVGSVGLDWRVFDVYVCVCLSAEPEEYGDGVGSRISRIGLESRQKHRHITERVRMEVHIEWTLQTCHTAIDLPKSPPM